MKHDSADPQKLNLYRWEDSWWGWNKSLITPDECVSYIFRACKKFDVKPPMVKFHKGNDWSWSTPFNFTISMQLKNHINIPIALHEASHHIVWHRWRRAQDHGQVFIGIYLHLLVKNKIASQDALEASLKSFKLKWIPIW